MAERPQRSPIRASSYAVWTYQHVRDQIKNSLTSDNKESRNGHQTKENKVKVGYETEEREADKENDRQDLIADEDEAVRKNVWSDVDDELYIAEIVRANVRTKRDTSVGDSEVVNSVSVDYEMWELDADYTECDCLGPPPEFLLPPPPRPPFLHSDYYCGDDPIPDLETCDSEPVSYFLNISTSYQLKRRIIGMP